MQKFVVVKGISAPAPLLMAPPSSANGGVAAAAIKDGKSVADSESPASSKTMETAVDAVTAGDSQSTSNSDGRPKQKTKENEAGKSAKTATSATPELQVKMSGYLKKKRKVSVV